MNVADWMPFSVLLPLVAAPICALLPGRLAPWLLTMACTLCAFAITAMVLPAAWQQPLAYPFGSWPPPVGIEFRVDAANALVALVLASMASLSVLWGRLSVDQEVPKRQGLFYALFLLAFAGLMGVTLTGDAFNVFVFLEISSLATYALIAHGSNPRALLAAFRYLVMGTIGATFLLIGIAFLYMMTGTLNMVDLADRLPEVRDTAAVHTALAFIVVGMGLKLAMFPLHLWLPNAYTYAPNQFSAFLAATATKVALYVILRFLLTVFAPDYEFMVMPVAGVLMVLGIAGMFAGSWVAMFQENLKRMLAYSSVAQVGYMVLAVSLATSFGIAAGFLHLFNHALMKAALFMALGTVFYRIGSVRLSDFAGIGRQMPWTMTAFTLAGLSLIGVPLTAGFISKWYLIIAAMDAGAHWLVPLIVLTSLMAVYYIWRVVEAAWFTPAPPGHSAVTEAPLALLVPLWIMVGLNFYFGIDTRLSVAGARAAAQALSGLAP